MRRFATGLILLLFVSSTFAQIRVNRLVIKAKETYDLGQTDIVVADTLIMRDSSRIVLNKLKRENYIRAKVAIFGNGCVIDGSGLTGANGRNGRNGETPIGPCKDGTSGRIGAKGLDGGNAVNLFLYFENIVVKGKLIISVRGGNGGNGGEGGHGGGGSPGTVHCFGGNGGNGAHAGNGGNGGNGGILTISCKNCPPKEELLGAKIIVDYDGGFFGYGGRGGYQGPPGLGPLRKNGVQGKRGFDGGNGKSGSIGDIKFETN